MDVPTTPNRRRIVTAVALAFVAAGGVAANADDGSTPTGSCDKSFDVAQPTTVSCSFTVTAPSYEYGGGGWSSPQHGSKVALWTFSMDVAGQPQPLNSCGGVGYSGCSTVSWDSDAVAAGSTIVCTVRAVGKGEFSCDSQKG